MKKKVLIILGIFIIIAIAVFFIVYKNYGRFSVKPDNSVILYVQDGCPHCATVEDYIKVNDVASKFSFIQKDITNDKSNTNDLFSKVKLCGWENRSDIGTPFLWDGANSECLMGDGDVVNFFKSQIASSTTNS